VERDLIPSLPLSYRLPSLADRPCRDLPVRSIPSSLLIMSAAEAAALERL